MPDLPEEERSPLERHQVRDAMSRVSGSSAGPDGWLGKEVHDASFDSESLTALFIDFERAACLPEAWTWARQVHLAKKVADDDFIMAAEDFRFVAVFSAFYKAWAVARLGSPCCRALAQ